MDDDGPRAAPKAGRRAGRRQDTWGDDSSAPPEPQKGGFGLDGGFGGGESSSPPPPPRARGGFGEMDGDSRHGGGASGKDDDDLGAPSRSRGGDASERSSAQRAPPPSGKSTNFELDLGGDSKKFVGVSRRKQEQLTRGDDEASRKKIAYEQREQRDLAHMTTGADGILEIPELEDEGREDLSNVVAEAPKVRTNKVQGMEELEEEAHYRLPAMDDRDIDLSLLTAVLCSSEQVQEADEPWDPDIILTEVASAINIEREKAEGGDPSAAADDVPINEMK